MTKQLHVISTGQQSIQTLMHIISEIHPYIDYIHLRERKWPAMKLMTAVQTLHTNGVPLSKIIINDRVDIAYVMNVKGVQLAHHSIDVVLVKQLFPTLDVGRSVHDLSEAKQAEVDGANMLMYGHIFPTLSKPGLTPRGLSNLQHITNHVHIPVIAIGGITPENTPSVIQSGATGIAVLSGILLAEDPLRQVKAYRQALK